MKIMCNIITGAIRDLAHQIGRSESYTCNLVSVWQTQNNFVGYPTASQLNELLKSNKEQAWDAYLAVPNYEVVEYNPSEVPIKHSDGVITLMRLPEANPMEHFFSMYKHLPELKDLVATPQEAYRFTLWREMAFMQHGLDKKAENRSVAEGEAIKKLKEWRKRHPVKVLPEAQIPTSSTTTLGHETKINIYAGTNENADLSNFAERPFVLSTIEYDDDGNEIPGGYEFNVKVPSRRDISYGSVGISTDGSKVVFRSVEAAFQAIKSTYSETSYPPGTNFETLRKQGKVLRVEDIAKMSGKEARIAGRNISDLNKSDWDKDSSTIMKELIKVSFQQNPQALQRLLATGNATLTHTQDKGKWGTEFPRLLMEVREELRNSTNGKTANPTESRGNVQTHEANKHIVSAAPYFRQKLTSQNKAELEKATQEVREKAQKLATIMGLEIEAVEVIGGTYLGNSEITYQYRVKSSDQELVDLFASLMGDLSFEYQDAVIAANYTKDETQINAYELVYQVPEGTTIEDIEATLSERGIEGSSFSFENNELSIIGFSEAEVHDLIKQLTNSKYEYKGHKSQNSRYLDNEHRRDAYRSWLNSKGHDPRSRQLNNACSKALAICEAAARFPEESQESERLKAAQQAAQQWDNSHQRQQQPEQRIVRSFSVEEIAEVKPQPQVVTQEDTNNVYKVPEIGTDVLRVDPNNPVARLARDFTAMERHDRVVMLARNFSNIVDQAVQEKVQENMDAISEEMSKEEPDRAELARLYERAVMLNDSVKGRRAVMQDKTVQQIFQQMREEIESYMEMTPEELDEDYGEGRGEYILNAYQKVLDNWDALLDEACIIIEGTENVRVVTNKHAYNTGTSVETVTGGAIEMSTQDADDEEANFGDDEDGNRADGNGGWSFKVRFVDPRTSLSRGVKRVLASIKKEGINGEPEVDDLGNIRYVNEEFAHAALINELSGMISPEDFSVKNDDGTFSFPALEKVAEKYPWANQVINALSAEPALISSFYADFRKDFIPYWMQYFDESEGKWKTFALNQAVALDSTRTSIINNYEQGTILDEDSIYEEGRKLNSAKAELGLSLSNDILSLLRDFDEDDYPELTQKVAKGLRMIGLNANEHIISNLLKSENGVVNLEKVVNAMRNIFEGIENMPDNSHLIDAFSDDYNTIAQEVGLVSELDNIQSFRNGDKTYYSYSAPNYVDTMFKIFKSDERRDAYLQEQFGKYNWFKNQRTGQWRSEWLRLIETDEDVRDQLMFKELNNISGIEYTGWEPLQIKSAFIREYFSVGYNKGSKKQFAWYNMPIFSDSPVVKFIKFLRYTSDSQQTFKDKLTPLFNQLVKQELTRIKLVQDRRKAGVAQIANFDKNGDKFHFFPELNTYNNGTFLSEAMRLTKAKDLEGLNNLINSAVSTIMRQSFESFLNTNFSDSSYESLRGDLLNDGVITSESQFEDALEEYFWNQAYATSQIIELTTTDLAYYKDGTDFQKRYKEVYAAGTKLNTNSQYGREIERTIYLADQIVTSSGYHDIKASLNRAVQLGHIQSFDRDNILNKFKDINVADAQAYRSISSMRAVLDMMGAWTPEMQQAMDRFENGEWDMSDFNVVWQTIKPFVFTQIEKPDGLGSLIKVPHHNKNSEFLLLSTYQMIANSMGRSPKLRAINRFMEDNNIDVIQFESAVKVGKQGTIDISYSEPKLQVWVMNNDGAWKDVLQATMDSLGVPNEALEDMSYVEIFKAGNDYLLDHNKISQEEYNKRFEAIEPSEQEVYDILSSMSMDRGEFRPEVVHEIPYTDYVIQQPSPEHLFDCVAVFGSQFRNLLISDMPDDPNFRVKVNGKELTKQQVLDLYQSNIVENLLEDWEKVKGKFADIRTLQKAMLDAVKGNPKYGRDMLDALQIVEITNPNTGEKQEVFNIPLDNPSTTAKIQELITSMFKNAITKQEIKGASCILVSDFGLTKELNIIHGEDGSIQGIECYLPAYSKEFYQPFAVTKVDDSGNEYQELDISKMPMELRRIIGYRIPTEDKYSMAPLIIKGFLPQQNGSCIMLPADITQIAGSDFDVDKMFLMIPEFRRQDKYAMKAAWDAFYQENPEITSQIEAAQWATFEESYQRLLKTHPEQAEEIDVEDERFKDWFVKESGLKNYEWVEGVQDTFFKWFKANKERFYQGTEVYKVKYDESKTPQEQSRAARNNMIIDIAWGILTHPDTAEKIHNPGGFDRVKIAARIATIISDPRLLDNFADEQGLMHHTEDGYDFDRQELARLLLKMSKEGKLDELDSFIKRYKVERSQLTVDTFIYNHRQNMTGGALIGMYANNTTMQAKFQVTGLSIKDDYVFTINGRPVQSLHDIISPNGERISKNCANFSAASVDNVKDPVLADLMQNTQTANITGFMLRAGMSIEEIGLLFSQPMVRKCIIETGGLKKLGGYIRGMIKALKENGGGVDEKIQLHDFTSEELMMNALNESRTDWTSEQFNEHLASQIQAGLLMQHIATIAQDLSDLTQIARADSPNGAISTSIAGAKNQVQKVNLYARRAQSKRFTLTGLGDIMQNDYVTAGMSTDQMREKLLKNKMPMLQAFYSLGIELPIQVMGQYFSQTTPYSDTLIEQLYNNAPLGIVPDATLNLFYSELVEFALSKTQMLGDDEQATFDEKRDYYLYDFPQEYLSTLASNPDIANMGIFKKMQVKDGNIVMGRSGRLTPMMRETLMRDFDMLLYMDNPAAQKLAIDLFMYSYYKDGFKFGPNSFGTFFSSNFISSFPEFVGALRELRFNMQSGTYFDNFLPQFYANHAGEGIVPFFSEDADVVEISDGKIAIDSKQVLNRNLEGKTKSYPLIVYNGGLYALSLDGSDRAIYEPTVVITQSQKNKRGVKYNANMTIQEMAGVETDEARVKANASLNPSNNAQGGFDGELFQALEDAFGGFEGMDDALAGLEQDYGEAAGQAQLDKPMCK